MSDLYILTDGHAVLCPDLAAWGKWFETEGKRARVVAQDTIKDVRVSTVFLGIDHRFTDGVGLPILWETMIFGGPHDDYQERYTSHEDAVAGHAKALAMASKDRS